MAYFYWSIRALEKARDALNQAAARDPLDSALVLNLALVSDELGDKTRRDENLEWLWTKHRGQAPRINQVCRVLRKWLAEGGKGEPDLASVNATIEGTDPDRRGDLEYFVGRLLMGHGKPELGRPYLQRVSDSPSRERVAPDHRRRRHPSARRGSRTGPPEEAGRRSPITRRTARGPRQGGDAAIAAVVAGPTSGGCRFP